MQFSSSIYAYRYPFAFVAFGGNRTHWWTKFLQKGFYHCLLLLGNGYEWILIDPVVHYTDLIFIKHTNPFRILQEKGYTILRTTPQLPTRPICHLRPMTCVETVKRFLGISNPHIWTPYQLYLYLKNTKKENFP